MTWSFKFVILVFTITWTYATKQLLPKPKNCTVKKHLPCLLYEPSDCRPESLQALFPYIYIDKAMSPGQAGSFHGEIGYMNRSYNNVKLLEVKLTFTPAQSEAIFLTKGFEVIHRIDSVIIPSVKCYIFDLGNAKWKNSDMNTVFSLIRGPLMIARVHYYELYALPKPFVEYNVYRNVQVYPRIMLDPKRRDIAMRWQASITTELYPAEKRILVRFSSPPEKFGFDSYNVKLYNGDTGAVSAEFYQLQETYLNFITVEPGNYSIWVQPHDPYWLSADISKCLCYDVVCRRCYTTKTMVFEMENGTHPLNSVYGLVTLLICFSGCILFR